MSTSIDQAGGMRFQGNAPASKVTTVQEAREGKAADGSAAPKGTKPVVVEQGDTLSGIMAKHGLNWNDPQQREQFLKDNPQFADRAGGRNPDLIWPGEVVHVRTSETRPTEDKKPEGPGETDPKGPTKKGDEKPEAKQETPQQAAIRKTDEAAKKVEESEKQLKAARTDPASKGEISELENNVSQAKTELFDAMQKEMEAGLEKYLADPDNKNATEEDIRRHTNYLSTQIQARSEKLAGIDDASMNFRQQQAINNVSARQQGIDLSRASPSTKIVNGPYTENKGPFEPNGEITLRDGSKVKIDSSGYPEGTSRQSLRPTAKDPQSATKTAANDYFNATQTNQKELKDEANTRLQNTVQREAEQQLQTWLKEHPGASTEDIKTKAADIVSTIVKREGVGNVIANQQDIATKAATYAAQSR